MATQTQIAERLAALETKVDALTVKVDHLVSVEERLHQTIQTDIKSMDKKITIHDLLLKAGMVLFLAGGSGAGVYKILFP